MRPTGRVTLTVKQFVCVSVWVSGVSGLTGLEFERPHSVRAVGRVRVRGRRCEQFVLRGRGERAAVF